MRVAADDERQPAQLGALELLDGGEERIEVEVGDDHATRVEPRRLDELVGDPVGERSRPRRSSRGAGVRRTSQRPPAAAPRTRRREVAVERRARTARVRRRSPASRATSAAAPDCSARVRSIFTPSLSSSKLPMRSWKTADHGGAGAEEDQREREHLGAARRRGRRGSS